MSGAHESLAFERLLVELSAGFINLPAERIDSAIESGLQRIVVLLDIDRSTVFRMWPDTGRVEATHSAAVSGVSTLRGAYVAQQQLPWALASLAAGQPVVFSRLDELPPQACVDRVTYEGMGLKAHVSMPFMVAGELHGSLNFGCTRQERYWSDELLDRMRLLAQIFASATARKRAQEELEQALGFAHLATNILASLLLAEAGDEAAAIERGLRDIGLFLQVDRVALWQRQPQRKEFQTSFRWTAPGADTPIDRVGDAEIPWINRRLGEHHVVRIARLTELPAAAARDAAALRALGLCSLLVVPHGVGGEMTGALSVGTVNTERNWPERLLPGLRLLAQVFASLNLRRSAEQRKRAAEAETAQWRERLAHLVRVHTVGEMSAALAHEITQPLGAIENYALAAQRRSAEAVPDRDKLAELLDKIVAQAGRAGDVVMRLRNMVKRHDLEMKEIDLTQVLKTCADMVGSDCELHELHIAITSEPGLPSVVADEIHVQQVVLNLLRNAMDAIADAPADGPKTIALSVRCAGRDGVAVQVADCGPGIAEGELERVFESFYSSKANGLGIGLGISRKLIEAHGGKLWAAHNPGGGALFQFTLPAAAD